MALKRSFGTVSMNDVANRAGVSQSTVSRVINHHPGIRPETRDTVLDALRELGYKSEIMNLIRPEPEPERHRISIVMCPLPEQADPFALEYFSLLAQGIRDEFAGSETVPDQQTLPAGATELPEPGRYDGVILLGYPSEALRLQLRESGIPYVIASGDMGSNCEDVVTANHFDGCAEGCAYLLGQGVKRVGFLLDKHGLSRYAGFQSVLLSRNIPVRPEDLRIVPDTRTSSYITAIHHWIAAKNLPEALVVSYVEAASAVKAMLELNRLRIPEDVRLLSFGHYSHSEPIATLDIDARVIGRRAGIRLLEKLRHPDDPPVQIQVPMKLYTP